MRQCALAEARGPITMLDVCCGTGTIGLGVAEHDGVAQLVGVEWSSEAVRDARHNAADNRLEHKALFVQGKAEEVIEQRLDSLLASVPEGGVVAVLDPPRVSPPPPTQMPRWAGSEPSPAPRWGSSPVSARHCDGAHVSTGSSSCRATRRAGSSEKTSSCMGGPSPTGHEHSKPHDTYI